MTTHDARSFRPRPPRLAPSPLAALLCLVLLAGPRPAAAVEFGLELVPSLSLPLGPFPDGVPLTTEGDPGYVYNLLLDMNASPGPSFALSMWLDNFTLRLAFTYHQLTSFKVTDLALVTVDGTAMPEVMQNIYLRRLAGLDSDPEMRKFFSTSWDVEDVTIAVYLNRVTLGYRWYMLDSWIRPYVPLGFGATFLLISADGETEAYYGMAFHTGVGLEISLSRTTSVGAVVQYEWMGLMLKENFQPDAAQAALTTTASTSKSAMEAFLESMHTLQIGVSTNFRF